MKQEPHTHHAAHDNGYTHRQAIYRAQSSLGMLGGAAAHLIKTGLILAPLVITELIPDAAKQRKAIKITSLGGAMLAEGLWAYRVSKKNRACRERLEHDLDVQDTLATAYGGMAL